MIRVKWLQDILYHASRLTWGPRWRRFHEAVRALYLGPVTGLLSFVLRPTGQPRRFLSLVPRHSTTSSGSFHAFQSDLDLSAVFAYESEAPRREIVRRHRNWQRRLPFLGELEVYTAQEYEELKALLSASSYPFLRRIRKLAWMEKARAASPSRYHWLKANRSIEAILRAEGIPLSRPEVYRKEFSRRVQRWVESLLKGTSPEDLVGDCSVPEPLVSYYLDSELAWNQPAGIRRLCLPRAHSLVLLSLTPSLDFASQELAAQVKGLRQFPPIREAWGANSRIECLVFPAVLRAQEAVTEADREWLDGFVRSHDAWRAEV